MLTELNLKVWAQESEFVKKKYLIKGLTEQIGGCPRHLQSVHYNCTSFDLYKKRGLGHQWWGDAYILVFIKVEQSSKQHLLRSQKKTNALYTFVGVTFKFASFWLKTKL
jgi:hypothetical protein